jgi:hypothetical protein
MEKTFEGWDKKVWSEWLAKLELLSLDQLVELTLAVGIRFGERQPTEKQAYILILDEADPVLLREKYDMIRNRNQ